MTRQGCGGCLLVTTASLAVFVIWWNFYIAFERTRSVSPDERWIATAYIDGTPVSAENEKVHVWRSWQPRVRWLGCNVLEAKNESRTRLRWLGPKTLLVEHGFRPSELLRTKTHCGEIRIVTTRAFTPYS